MFFTFRDFQRVGHVQIGRLEQYLRVEGWTLDEEHSDERRRLWDKDGVTVTVPARPGFADHARRITDVVETLARFEDLYPDAILDDLLREGGP